MIRIIVVLCCLLLVTFFFLFKSNQAKEKTEKENSGLQILLNDSQSKQVIGKGGESLTIQPRVEVSQETFSLLMDKKIKAYEKRMNFKFGKVQSVVEATLTTVSKSHLVGKDTIMIFSFDTTKAKRDTVVFFQYQNKFESGQIIVKGKNLLKIDSSENKIAILQTKDKWKIKHLLPWMWGTRQTKMNLLIFNKNTRVDTLRNLNIIK
jgi:hypothetical protein